LTFDELRLASALHQPTRAVAMAELTELARTLIPLQTLERFLDGETIDAHTRLLRQHDSALPLLARALADMVIQIDRFAALNSIDLAAAIRQRFDEIPKQPESA
jgi:hypothetical protein